MQPNTLINTFFFKNCKIRSTANLPLNIYHMLIIQTGNVSINQSAEINQSPEINQSQSKDELEKLAEELKPFETLTYEEQIKVIIFLIISN